MDCLSSVEVFVKTIGEPTAAVVVLAVKLADGFLHDVAIITVHATIAMNNVVNRFFINFNLG